MDTKNLKALFAEKQWMQPTLLLGLGVLFIVLFYALIFAPARARMTRAKNETIRLQSVLKQYQNFSAMADKVAAGQGEIVSLNARFDAKRLLAPLSEQTFLEELGRACKKSDISLDRSASSAENGSASWSLSFSAGFERTVSFFSQLERMARIEQFSIKRDGSGPRHAVEMTVSPIVISPSAGATGGDDFMLLFQNTSALADEIVKQVQQEEQLATVARDPLSGSVTVPAASGSKRREEVVELPRVTVDGIFWDPGNPLVSIDGKVLKEGDTIRGITIIQIERNKVNVSWRSHTFALKMTKKEAAE